VTLYALTWCVLTTLAPAALPVCLALDLLRATPPAAMRLYAFVWWYLTCELFGIVAAVVLWLVRPALGATRFHDANFVLQCLWGSAVGRGAFALFGIRLDIDWRWKPDGRPFVLFMRHASMGDTILAVLLLSAPHRIVLRYVLKRELLWDPCLDIVGNRLRNVFVRRDGSDSQAQTAEVAALAADLRTGEGVMFYPEGTRWSAAKHRRLLERLEAGDDRAAAARAAELRHVLPPRLGGSLALLAAAEDLDVVFCSHTGFEGSATLGELWAGAVVHRTIHARFWSVPGREIPAETEERIQWLHRQWVEVDRFIEEKR
jgi:1-acyl-sn-glycerol-3-phosphate acyltransferase